MTCKKGAFFNSGSGADRGPRFVSSGRCQCLSCCSSAESDPTASVKENQICVTQWLPQFCRQALNVFCARPNWKEQLQFFTLPQTLVRSPSFFLFFIGQQFATTAAWAELSHWMVALLWSICCHEGAFVLWGMKASKTEHNSWQLTVYYNFSQSIIKKDVLGKWINKYWSKWRYNTTSCI